MDRRLQQRLARRVEALENERRTLAYISRDKHVLPEGRPQHRQGSRIVCEQVIFSSKPGIARGDVIRASGVFDAYTDVIDVAVEQLHIPRLRNNVDSSMRNNNMTMIVHQSLSVSEVVSPAPGETLATVRVENRNGITLQKWHDTSVALNTSEYFLKATYNIACVFAAPISAAELIQLLASTHVTLQLQATGAATIRDMLSVVQASNTCVRLRYRTGECYSRVMSTIINEPSLQGTISLEFGSTALTLHTGAMADQQRLARNDIDSAQGLKKGTVTPLYIASHKVTAVSPPHLTIIQATLASPIAVGVGIAASATATQPTVLVKHVVKIDSAFYLIGVPSYAAVAPRLQEGTLYVVTGVNKGVSLVADRVTSGLTGLGCAAPVSVGESISLQDSTHCLCDTVHAASPVWPYNIYCHVQGGVLLPAVSKAQSSASLALTADGVHFKWAGHHTPVDLHSAIGYDAATPLAAVHRRVVLNITLADGVYSTHMAVLQLRHHLRKNMALLDTTQSESTIDVAVSAVSDIPSTTLKTSEQSCTSKVEVHSTGEPLTLFGLNSAGLVVAAGTTQVHATPSRPPRAFFDRNAIVARLSVNHGTVTMPLRPTDTQVYHIIVPEGDSSYRYVYTAPMSMPGSMHVFPLAADDIQPSELFRLNSAECSLHYKASDGEIKPLLHENSQVPFTIVLRVMRIVAAVL